MGHLQRSVALARAVKHRNDQSRSDDFSSRIEMVVLTNSPFVDSLPLSAETGEDVHVIALNAKLNRDETVAGVRNVFSETEFDVLIVDTFPRGLGGELPDLIRDLRCPKILIHRDLNRRYIDRANVARTCQQFDQLIVPGEAAPFESFPHAIRTAPWLTRDASELLAPTEARSLLQVRSETVPVVAVLGCGRHEEVEEMEEVAQRLSEAFHSQAAVRFIAPRRPASFSIEGGAKPVTINLWPFMQVLRGVTVVVGSGGYNTVQETRAVGVQLVGLPRQRLYDSQVRRLHACEVAEDYQAIRSLVNVAIESHHRIEFSKEPRYPNGVHEAIGIIESLVESKRQSTDNDWKQRNAASSSDWGRACSG
jgi:hypothetical protein